MMGITRYPNRGKIATGTWSDTTTVIPANGTYTKTIPLPFAATKGRLIAKGGSNGGNGGAFIMFTTNANDAISMSTSNGDLWIVNRRPVDAYLTPEAFNNDAYIDVRIQDVYISGTNLNIVFKNTSGSGTRTLGVLKLLWEVEG